jgi:AcrR family transcriptional regulator
MGTTMSEIGVTTTVPEVEKRGAAGGDSELHRLPRGRHGLPRELVAENQRARLINGIIEAVAEQGYGDTTVSHVTAAAKVSRRTFYESFKNKEDCYRAAYEACLELVEGEMLAAAERQETWPERVRAGLEALLEVLAPSPDLAAFFVISPTTAGDAVSERHYQAMSGLISALTASPPDPPAAKGVAPISPEVLAGGVTRLIAGKVSAGKTAELPDLLPGLTELILRPFVGTEEAIRVARG